MAATAFYEFGMPNGHFQFSELNDNKVILLESLLPIRHLFTNLPDSNQQAFNTVRQQLLRGGQFALTRWISCIQRVDVRKTLPFREGGQFVNTATAGFVKKCDRRDDDIREPERLKDGHMNCRTGFPKPYARNFNQNI